MTAARDSSTLKSPDLRLRPDPQVTVRLSRKFLIGLSALGGLGLGGALILALQPQLIKPAKAAVQTYSTKSKPLAALFNALPRDYSAVPQLGRPLPGDLGKAVLANQASSPGTSGASATMPAAAVSPGPTSPTRTGPTAAQPSPSQAHTAATAARSSELFVAGHPGPTSIVPETPTPSSAAVPVLSGLAQGGVSEQSQSKSSPLQKADFLNHATDRKTLSPDRLQDPASPYMLSEGNILPAALLTGLRSDLPGQVTAQITQNIYDSLTGRFLLIPQGSRLIGNYDNAIVFGQSRLLLAWTRLILPNGRSLVLEKLSAADPSGLAGLSDRTDYHWSGMLQAAAISTVLSVGAEAGSSNNDSTIVRALRTGASDSISRTGQQIVERQLNIQPTLTIRPGFPLRVILSRDIVLEPYGD